MEPTAQAVGKRQKNDPSPVGAKDIASGNLAVHLIFSTKQGLPLSRPELRCALFADLGGIARELRGSAITVNGTADHVHMLVRMRPLQAAADPVRVVKTNFSR